MQSYTSFALILAGLTLSGCSTTDKTSKITEEETRLLQLAQDIERRGDRTMAASLYQQAAKVSADTVGAHVRLGEAQLAAGEPEAAAKSFRIALDTSPDDGRALLGLGTAQLKAGQVVGSARTLAAAAAITGTSTAYNRLGTALILSGDGNAAKSAFSRASDLDAGNLDTRSNFALAAAVSGDTAAATKTLNEVTTSPRAETRHFLNLMLVLVLDRQDRTAAAVAVPDYPEADKKAFLANARKVRTITSPAERARAIGLLSSG